MTVPKSPKEYFMAELAMAQKKSGTRLKGQPTKKDQELMLVGMDALIAQAEGYNAVLSELLEKMKVK